MLSAGTGFLLLAAVAFSQVRSIQGDWTGTLDARGVQLRIVLHIGQSADGRFTSKLDSLDQHLSGIPAAKTSFENGFLRLDIPQMSAKYVGRMSADGTEIIGSLTQGQALALTFHRSHAAAPKAAPVLSVEGLWEGTLDEAGGKLRLALHISKNAAGGLEVKMDSIDQGTSVPAASASFTDAKLRFEIPSAMVKYEGAMRADGSEIEGEFTQGSTMPLTFKRVEKLVKP